MIYWFTGQPGHGKTTLAKKLKQFIEESANLSGKVVHVDGDDLRGFTQNMDYSKEGRRMNIALAQQIARFWHGRNHVVIVSLVAPFRDLRERFKADTSCREIYVHTEVIRGKEHFHTEYEKPLENFLPIDTTADAPEVSLQIIIEHFNITY